jgi:DnaJ-domain-containing protein 1
MNQEYHGTERRDAIAPVLRLGQALVEARRTGASGLVVLRAEGEAHSLEISQGTVYLVRGPKLFASCEERAGTVVLRLARDLFLLRRPLVEWNPRQPRACRGHVDPESVVLAGMLARQDLFDPVAMVERIPTTMLRLNPDHGRRLRHLPLQPDERKFLEALSRPTPVTLAIWKRGLAPRHAAALLTGFNLLGAFEDQWAPADFPRCGALRRLESVLERPSSDYKILDVYPDADEQEIDSAYRRLARTLHPDCTADLPEAERWEAAQAFACVTQAYTRLKKTRRRRRVRQDVTVRGSVDHPGYKASTWEDLARQAENEARVGSRERARAYALKAMAFHPPEHVKLRLLGILAA